MKNRKRNPLIIPAAIGALFGAIGCAHFQQPRATPDAPESVGTLTPSETHVASAPVHATTDFGHAEIVETPDSTDDAGPVEMAVAPVAKGVDASAPPADETPDIAPKNAHGF